MKEEIRKLKFEEKNIEIVQELLTKYENEEQEPYEINYKQLEAIRSILNLYLSEKEKNKLIEAEFERLENLEDKTDELTILLEKEKEKNKELKNVNLTTVYLKGFYDGEKKWKDKAREKIKELKELDRKEYAKQGNFECEISTLQELLEEE